MVKVLGEALKALKCLGTENFLLIIYLFIYSEMINFH